MFVIIRVVIVEDEPLVKKGLLLTTPWEEYNCQVVGEASNGIEGIEVIAKLEPDLVLTDVRMPGLDGIMMIDRLKDIVDTEYIILSGYSEFDYAQSAIRLGVKEYLVKPVSDKDLELSIKNAVQEIGKKKEYHNFQKHMEYSEDSKVMLFKEYLSKGTSSKADNMNKAIEYVQNNYFNDISLGNICEEIKVSESYLSRLFKKESSYTFNDYLTNYRIKQACELLNNPQIRIYDVASQVGYGSQRYFSNIFKKLVGMTPGEFREKGVKK